MSTQEWFDSLPKTLKIMYAMQNPDLGQDHLQYYKTWDNDRLVYSEFSFSTRQWIRRSHERLKP